MEFNATLKYGNYFDRGKENKGYYLEIKLTEKYTKNHGVAADAAGLLKHQGIDILTGKLVSGKGSKGDWKAIDFHFHEKLRERCFLSNAEACMIPDEDTEQDGE